MKLRAWPWTLAPRPGFRLRRLTFLATVGMLAGSAAIAGLAATSAPSALADTAPYSASCTSNFTGAFQAIGIVTTGSLSQNPVPPGGSETLNNYGIEFQIPAAQVNAALADLASVPFLLNGQPVTLAGTISTTIDATNISPASTPVTLDVTTGPLVEDSPLSVVTTPMATPPSFGPAASTGIVHITQDSAITFDFHAATGVSFGFSAGVACTLTPVDIDTAVIGLPTAPQITSAASDTVLAGTPFTDTITATGVLTPALAASPPSALPAGVTFTDNGDGTATLAGTTGVAPGVYPFTVTAQNGVSPDASQAFILTVLTPVAPQITSAASDTVLAGTPFTDTITATGTPTPALAASPLSALPAGVTFTDNGDGTATLAGNSAVAPGVYTFTIQAGNGVNPNAAQVFTLTVAAPGAPQVTSPAGATITAGTAMSPVTITTDGFPAPSLSRKGPLPAGVTFVDNLNGTATISGNPGASTGGTYVLTITATNNKGTATQIFTITVDQVPAITSHASTTFMAGGPGTFTVTTKGFPAPALTYTGSLPPGVSLADNLNGTATISGTPTADGSYPIVVTASNAAGSVNQYLTINVNQALAITSSPAATVTAGTAMAPFTVTTSGFPLAVLSKTGVLPSGVTFVNNHDGTATISGVPKANQGGNFVLTITASNSLGTVTQTFTLVVDEAPIIASHTSTTFTVGDSGTLTVIADGFPAPALTWTGTLPPGMAFTDNGDGTASISGIPTVSGSYPIVITAMNVYGTVSQSLTLKVS